MNERQIITLTPQLDVVYRHRLAFSCMLAIGLGLTACAILILPGLYRSTTMVRIEPPQLTAAVAAAPNGRPLCATTPVSNAPKSPTTGRAAAPST